jgi:hypothetical protein
VTARKIQINRASVLTLWATVVAERLGYDGDESLSLAKAITGLTAQTKGRRLGIYKPVPAELNKARARKRGEQFWSKSAAEPYPPSTLPTACAPCTMTLATGEALWVRLEANL